MGYTGIHHLAFATADMDGTVRFWRDLLGMRLVYAYGHPGYRQYFFEVSERDLLSFFEWPEVEPVRRRIHGTPVKGPFIFDHVAIGVENETRLWEIADRLFAAEIPVSDVIDHGFIRSVYSYDPNGIPIEFTCNVPEVDIRAHPVMKDAAPGLAAREGAGPVAGKWPEPAPAPPEERVVIQGEGWENFRELGRYLSTGKGSG